MKNIADLRGFLSLEVTNPLSLTPDPLVKVNQVNPWGWCLWG